VEDINVESLYQKKVNCTHCQSSFETSKVRSSQKRSAKSDTDFCVHYKAEDVNPEYYVIHVCPFCGFAFSENSTETMSENSKKVFADKVSSRWKQRDYGGVRTWEDAMQTYKLALICAQIQQEKDRVIAGILQHIAWLYRYKSMEKEEKQFLRFALEAYIRVYEYEEQAVNNAKLMYLIGELHRRLNEYNEAVKWFTRVINDKNIMDSGMIRACREQWAKTREDMRNEST
jgi:uncharacterized protein (DUF2225 family)